MKLLIPTDIAARVLDLQGSLVVNVDGFEESFHRSGRVAGWVTRGSD